MNVNTALKVGAERMSKRNVTFRGGSTRRNFQSVNDGFVITNMINEGIPDEVLNTNYCLICRRLFIHFCNCMPDSNKAIIAIHFFKTSYIELLAKFLFEFTNFTYQFLTNLLAFNHFSQPNLLENVIVLQHDPQILNCDSIFCFTPKAAIFPNNFTRLLNQKHSRRRKFIPKGNFYVYMLMVHLQDEDAKTQPIFNEISSDELTESSPRPEIVRNSASSSTLSATSKLSGTGGKFSSWIRQSKKRKEGNEQGEAQKSNPSSSGSENSLDKNPTEIPPSNQIPVRKTSSKSKIPLLKPTMKLGKRRSTNEDSDITLSKTSRKSAWFFRKPKAKTGRSASPESSAGESLSFEKIAEKDQQSQGANPLAATQTYSTCSLKIVTGCNSPLGTPSREVKGNCSLKSCSSYDVPQSHPLVFISPNLALESNLTDGLREVTEFSARLRESEQHLTHIISKYIQDHNLQKELVDAMTNHAKLQLEAERRAQALTTAIWSQQSEMMKTQERERYENIKILVRENRKLQDELETVTRRNEKLYIKVNQFPERNRLRDGGSQVLENLSRNNDKLRYKTSVMLTQIEDQEKDIHKMRRKTDTLEQLLRNSNSQLQNSKALLQRAQSYHEVEYSNLSHQLQVDRTIIKESVEAGDVLLEDLDGLKRQLKSLPCTLNWTKLKSRGNSLPDLIYMCRSCINELSKELANATTDIVLKEKDTNILKEEIARVEKCLEASKSEQERLNDQLEMLQAEKGELQKYSSKCNDLQLELNENKRNLEKTAEDLKKEKACLAASFNDIDNLNRKIIEKDEELTLTKEKMCEYTSENDALRMQLHGLKQVLAASGTGDVARELADTQEKLTFFQSQYYQLLSEKNYLIEQVQTANMERGALNDFQSSYYQFIQIQQHDLEVLSKENVTLKEELETEHNRSSIFHAERNKLREEKNILRKIYHQLKSEINKVPKLEGEVLGMNMEANRLAIIAEYNKQLGEKLQCEVTERDVKISELRNNMDELNMAQMENVQDKVALCVELSEVCTLNDKLNYSLVNEQQKIVHLDKTKKKFEDAATTQLRAIEETQKVERAALKDLLRDYKVIVRQRDNLLGSQNEYLQQISDLRAKAALQTKKIESLNYEVMRNLETTTNFERKTQELEGGLAKARDELSKRENHNAQQQLQIEKLNTQNEALESSRTYLQNTLQKIHNDLNEALRSKVEAKLEFEKQSGQLRNIQTALDHNIITLEERSQENEKMAQQISELNGAYAELAKSSKQNTSHLKLANKELKSDLGEVKTLVQIRAKELQFLENAFAEKELEVIEMQQYNENLTEQLKDMETSMEDIDLQSRLLSESNSKQARLKDLLATIRVEHDRCSETVLVLRKKNDQLQQELTTQAEKTELYCDHYRKYIEDIVKENTQQKKQMEGDLQLISKKFQELQTEYADQKSLHAQLLASHKDIAGKLLKAIRMLVNEKLNRQGAEASVTSLSQKNMRLSSEKEAVENMVVLLSNELWALKTKFEELTADKVSIRSVLSDLEELQRQVQTKELIQTHDIETSCSYITLPLTDDEHKLEFSAAEDQIKELNDEVDNSYRKIMELAFEISHLKQELTVMEFKKSELVLRLHETEAQLKVEQNMNKELTETNQKFLSEVLGMQQEGMVTRPVLETLMNLVQGQPWNNCALE